MLDKNEQEQIKMTEETRQLDLNAMLLALLLIERGQIDQAKQVLINRMPVHIAVPLKTGKP
jgi:hypothetical protein